MSAAATVSIGASMGEALSFGWNVLKASRTAFTRHVAGIVWALGLGLLMVLISAESSALGLETKAAQIALVAMVWGPMTLGFLVAHGLNALSKPLTMVVLPSMKRRALQASIGFGLLAALIGAVAAAALDVYGVFNGALSAAIAYVAVLGLFTPGRPDFVSILLIVWVGIYGRVTITPILQGTETPTMTVTLLSLLALPLGFAGAMYLFRPRENAIKEHDKQRRLRAPRARFDAGADVAALANASPSARIQRAAQFSRQSRVSGPQLKWLASALLSAAVPILLILAFVYFFKGGRMASPTLTAQLFLSMLVLPLFLGTFHHGSVPLAAFSRETLADYSFRQFLRSVGAWLTAIGLVAAVFAGFLALATDDPPLEWVSVLSVASLFVLPALPWAFALGLFAGASKFVRRWSIPGLEKLCAGAPLMVAQWVLVMVGIAATRYAEGSLGTTGPPKMLWLLSAVVLGGGLVALRMAFHRHYRGASLEPVSS